MKWTRDKFELRDEATRTAVDSTFALLQTTYWAHKRPIEIVREVIEQSLCLFLFHDGLQIGFARVVSDYTTLSWVADVVVSDAYRGRGLGKWLMECLMSHPRVAHTQFALQTGDAHRFYQSLGFEQNDALMSTAVDYL